MAPCQRSGFRLTLLTSLQYQKSQATFHLVEGNALELVIRVGVEWLRLTVETLGALIVGIGVIVAGTGFGRALLSREQARFVPVRISFARFLALALEFQLGADILSTAIAPSWEQIGKLGAIAIIRTALNFFLMREMKEAASTPERKIATEALGNT